MVPEGDRRSPDQILQRAHGVARDRTRRVLVRRMPPGEQRHLALAKVGLVAMRRASSSFSPDSPLA